MADPTITELAKTVADNNVAMTTAVNMVWTLIGGFLVMFMMAGFALVETGLTRAKNSAHTMAMNLFACLVVAVWLLSGRLNVPTRGQVLLWGVVIVVVALSIAEIRACRRPDSSRSTASRL